jgi:hypothetical protein
MQTQNTPPYMFDLLQIDAEGFDYMVLQGGSKFLQRHLARVLIFEYNQDGPWGALKLHDAIRFLASKSYICYFMGETNRLWRLTGKRTFIHIVVVSSIPFRYSPGCWDDQYEFHKWSNVIRVRHADPWYDVLDQMRVTAESAQEALRRIGLKS